jgi:hypothetical protein
MLNSPSARADGVVNSAIGSFAADGTACIINLGFVPHQVIVFNETDVIRWEKLGSQVAANCIKTIAAGTMTLDTTSAIVINADGTVTLSAALCANGKAIKYRAMRS